MYSLIMEINSSNLAVVKLDLNMFGHFSKFSHSEMPSFLIFKMTKYSGSVSIPNHCTRDDPNRKRVNKIYEVPIAPAQKMKTPIILHVSTRILPIMQRINNIPPKLKKCSPIKVKENKTTTFSTILAPSQKVANPCRTFPLFSSIIVYCILTVAEVTGVFNTPLSKFVP